MQAQILSVNFADLPQIQPATRSEHALYNRSQPKPVFVQGTYWYHLSCTKRTASVYHRSRPIWHTLLPQLQASLTRHPQSTMAGPVKKRAEAEKKSSDLSNDSASQSRDLTQRSTKSIPRLDGNRDPSDRKVVDYTVPNDLKNLSEFLSMRGWYAARGVSTNAFQSQSAHASAPPMLRSIISPSSTTPIRTSLC